MFLGAWEGHHRSLAKAISWRLAGSMDTLLLSYLVTRNLVLASSIAGAETVTKVVLYYAHERAWTAVPWGQHSRMYRLGFPGRIWTAKNATALAAVRSHLQHPSNPARLGVIGSFLFCFAIVVSPPQALFKRSTAAESPMATAKEEPGSATIALLERAGTPAAVPDPAHQTSDLAPESAQSAALIAAAPKAEPQVETPLRNLLERDSSKEVQQRLIQLGYLSASATGLWGPLSRRALKLFKSDHDLTADEIWDEATQRGLFSGGAEKMEAFVGIWGIDASACSPRLNRKGFLPAVIDRQGAWAGETFCAFKSKKRTGRGWDFVASCSNTQDRWTANVRLILVGDQLTWRSERGSQSYLRCQPALGIARVF